MRSDILSALEAGITRLRTKGGASPKSLYDLMNGWVNFERDCVIRPGSVIDSTLPSGTKGFVTWHNKFYVFATTIVVMTDPRYVCEVLIHPTDLTLTLAFIHFASPIAGFLYVSAEFSDGSIHHYWLQHPVKWTASTTYVTGTTVEPTVNNGFIYRATRVTAPSIKWAAGIPRAVNDRVEPTSPNGFYYLCINTLGAKPVSGAVEPVWPTSEGAQVYEDTNASTTTVSTVVVPPTGTTTPPPTTVGGYGSGIGAGRGATTPPKLVQ